jgi:threonine dehydrogenase-like Zn-dependent dehydrogenase
VRELTNGEGVDVVLENTGSSEPISQSLDIVRKGGRVLWAGAGIRGGVTAPVDTYQVLVKELNIKGEISQVPTIGPRPSTWLAWALCNLAPCSPTLSSSSGGKRDSTSPL